MPKSPAFQARVDSADGRLTLAGDCRTADLEAFESVLREWGAAGARSVDLTAAGRFDIGPAWILKRAMADAAAAPAVSGSPPAHFAYLDELLDGASARTADIAPLPTQPAGLVRLGPRDRGPRRKLVRSADVRRQAHQHGGLGLALMAPPAHCVRRAARLRDRLPGRAGSRGDRVPDQRDLGVHQCATVAAVRRRDLHRRHRGARRAARVRRAAHGDHGRGPHRQRLCGRTWRNEAQRRSRRARVDGHRPVRGAGAAARSSVSSSRCPCSPSSRISWGCSAARS